MDKWLIAAAAAAIFVPLAIGIARGRIPKEAFHQWALPLAGVTVFLAMGVQFVESRLDPVSNLILSIIFGCAWTVAGGQTVFFRPHEQRESDVPTDKLARALGWMFLIFGLIWIGLSIIQYLRRT